MIYGNPEVTSGGQALKYYASVRWVHRTARWQLILQGCTSALGHSAPPTHLAQLCQDERCQSHRQRLLQPLQPGHTGQPAAQPHKHNLGCPCPPPLALQAGGAHQREDFGGDAGPDRHPRQVSAHQRALCRAVLCCAVLCCAAAWPGPACCAGMLCWHAVRSSTLHPLLLARVSLHTALPAAAWHTPPPPFPPLAAGPL